jgi:RHS repeat-associated protein
MRLFRASLLSLVSFLLFFILLPVLPGQTVQNSPGTPTPGVGHDYTQLLGETVDLSSGALSLRIGMPVPPGRKLALPFAFVYNSKPFTLAKNASGTYIWTAPQAAYSSGTWSYSLPQLKTHLLSFADPLHPGNTCYGTTNYAFTDANGTRHALNVSAIQNPTSAWCIDSGWLQQLDGGDDFVSTHLSAPGSLPTSITSGPVAIADPDGTVYSFGDATHPAWGCNGDFVGSSATSGYGLPTSIEDRNGNKITFSIACPGNVVATDTVGRAVLSLGGTFGQTGSTVSVAGVAQPYTLTWGGTSPLGLAYTATNIGEPAADCDPFTFSAPPGGGGITAITLPNSTKYQFSYDSTTGYLNKITHPTGGYVSYTWGPNPQSAIIAYPDKNAAINSRPNFNCQFIVDQPAVLSRSVSFDGSTVALRQTYSYTTTWSNAGGIEEWTSKTTTVTTNDLVRGVTFTTKYTYASTLAPQVPNVGFPPLSQSQVPIEQTISYRNPDGTVAKTVNKGWGDLYTMVCEEDTLENGLVKGVFYQYGPGHVITDKKEYDYNLISATACGSGPPTVTATRETTTAYQSFQPTPLFPTAASIFDRPSSVTIYDNGTEIAQTTFGYDETAVTPVTLLTGHDDTNYSSTYNNRGNSTTKTVQCLQVSSCSNAVTKYVYDETGQVTSVLDPNGNTTGMSYSDSFVSTNSTGFTTTAGAPPTGKVTNAYLTTVTLPVISGVSHIESYSYGYNDGQVTQSIDQNSQQTTYKYNDLLGRLTETDYPDTGQTTISYNDVVPVSATTTETISSTLQLQSQVVYDGLGRARKTALLTDPSGTDYTRTSYDGLGRLYQKWNPTRCDPDVNPTSCKGETTFGVTTYTYDVLDRTTKITKPDGSSVNKTYAGNTSTVSDEATNQRETVTDGLGRVTVVFEAPNVTGVNYETDYVYNALDDLTNVTQKGGASSSSWRVRNFIYNSLGQLTSGTNPESGTITYSYDANGNLTTKIGPRPSTTAGSLTTNYAYDALNRLTKRSYVSASTQPAMYGYDGVALVGCNTGNPSLPSPTNLIGRRSEMCAGPSHSLFSYDSMGRVVAESRKQVAAPSAFTKNTAYTYFVDGELKTITYPSGDVLTYTSSGSGLPRGLSDASNNFVSAPSSGAMYTPNGALASMTQGAGITTNNSYNSRLQPVVLTTGTTSANFLSLTYDFHLGTGDNGNVFQVINNLDSTRSAAFQYDALNRIQQANTITTTGANCWGEVYTIDGWGNLIGRSGPSGMTGCATEGLSVTASTTNHLSGLIYDAAGDVTNDGNGNTPTYDAEARMATVAGVTYDYDADGVRVRKNPGGLYWPDMSGSVLAESDLTGTLNEEYVFFNGERIARVDRPSGAVHYYFSDQLGSATVIADSSGNAQEMYYYYPYGGMQSSTGSDSNHYKFTGKERDTESNLDNFGARYYTSNIGRFMTPDWAARPTAVPYAIFGDPQSLNLYAYVRNDPVSTADADGHTASSTLSWQSYFAGLTNMQLEECDYVCLLTESVNQQDQQNQPAQAQNQPLTSVTVLGMNVAITYGAQLSVDAQLAAGNAIAAAAELLNKNAASLTADEKKAIGQISSFSVAGPNSKIGASGKGSMTLTGQYIKDSSAAWLGSLFGHEGQHYLNHGKYSGVNLWKDEQSAGRMQLGIGNKIGFNENERHTLELWIDDKHYACVLTFFSVHAAAGCLYNLFVPDRSQNDPIPGFTTNRR